MLSLMEGLLADDTEESNSPALRQRLTQRRRTGMARIDGSINSSLFLRTLDPIA